MNIPHTIQVYPNRLLTTPHLTTQCHSIRGKFSSELIQTRRQLCFRRHLPANECRSGMRIRCEVQSSEQSEIPARSVSVILLAGGVGKRMGAKIPKQFIELQGRAIATYSFEIFAKMMETGEIVVVVDPSWKYIFEECAEKIGLDVPLKWGLPGKERQDSVYNGFQEIDQSSVLVSIHDSARPLVDPVDVQQCLQDGLEFGAAVLGVKVKPTIKEVGKDLLVERTLERAKLWEVQTPQIIQPKLLKEGFEYVKENQLEVTDDVSIIEALGLPVKITEGSYTNLKLTTPDDLSVAERLLSGVPA